MDFFSNTNRTWYLTATFDRSDKTESACFKRAFSSVEEFGYKESEEITRKHVIYHIVNINSHITPKDRGKVQGYRGLTSQSYGKYAFFDDKNQTAYQAILKILEKLTDVEGKILIFVPLISAIVHLCISEYSNCIFLTKDDISDKESQVFCLSNTKEESKNPFITVFEGTFVQ